MVDTKNKEQTATAGVDMREEGVPPGQAMAPRQAAQAAKEGTLDAAAEQMLAYVEENKASISRLLITTGVSFDLFEAALRTFLIRQKRETPEFFINLNPESFLEAILRIARNGLLPDGKEAAITAFKDTAKGMVVAQAMFMRDGFVKVLWRTGMIKSINDQVVTEGEYTAGRFEYEEGDDGFIRHRPDLMRKDSDPVAAAYCVIEMMTGGFMREVVPKDELEKIRKLSKSPARKAWQHQMDRKAAIRRIMGKMPREAGVVQLLKDDEDAYDLDAAGGSGPAKALTPAEMLSGRVARPARRPRRQASEPSAPLPAIVSDSASTAEQEPAHHDELKHVGDAAAAVTMLRGAVTVSELMEAIHEIDPTLEHMDDEGRSWVAEEKTAAEKRIMGEGGLPEEEEPTGEEQGDVITGDGTGVNLTAILSTAQGKVGYVGADDWKDDILNRMKELDGAKLAAFWKVNLGFVLEAGEQGIEQAEEIMDAARHSGLPEVEV